MKSDYRKLFAEFSKSVEAFINEVKKKKSTSGEWPLDESMQRSIVEKKVPQMTYSKGGRTYATDYFLEIIAKHIVRHALLVKRAK